MSVGAIDENRICERNIQPVLDDGCRDQHVVFVPHEGEHHFFKLRLSHLSVPYENTSLRHEFADFFAESGELTCGDVI